MNNPDPTPLYTPRQVASRATREHGGNLTAAEKRFGRPEEGWIDLSTGLNPFAYPVDEGLLGNDLWDRLPDDGLMGETLSAARHYYKAPSVHHLAMAPGTQALIQWLPRLRDKSCVQIVTPTYNEHAASWALAGHDVESLSDLADVDDRADVVVVVNPNNPDGRVWSRESLRVLAGQLSEKGGWLVIDEAFGDVLPQQSLGPDCGVPGVIVLRSFGKFFGLAGARLGFALTNRDLAQSLTDAMGPWAIAGPTLAIAAKALQDKNWIDQTLKTLSVQMTRLHQLLSDHDMTVIGGTDLFVLANTGKALDLFDHLAGKGILVRVFEGFPDRVRFGLPKTDRDWQRLEAALTAG